MLIITQPLSSLVYQILPLPSVNPCHPTGEQFDVLDKIDVTHSSLKTSSKLLSYIKLFFGPTSSSPSTSSNKSFKSFALSKFCIFIPKSYASSGT